MRRPRLVLFIAGLALFGFVPLVFATIYLFGGPYDDVAWLAGVISLLVGTWILLWIALTESQERRRRAEP